MWYVKNAGWCYPNRSFCDEEETYLYSTGIDYLLHEKYDWPVTRFHLSTVQINRETFFHSFEMNKLAFFETRSLRLVKDHFGLCWLNKAKYIGSQTGRKTFGFSLCDKQANT